MQFHNRALTRIPSTGEIVKHVEPIESSNKGPSFERFRSLSFNNDGSLLATTGEDKELRIWDTESWSEISKRSVPKRVNALHFTRDGKTIVEADKFGDVYWYFDCENDTHNGISFSMY